MTRNEFIADKAAFLLPKIARKHFVSRKEGSETSGHNETSVSNIDIEYAVKIAIFWLMNWSLRVVLHGLLLILSLKGLIVYNKVFWGRNNRGKGCCI